mmetsp:Transcript_361/g.611  ORF Transcript_361/g.611 Transcript_361/m.611 type:complete len:225 (-) Transcript_361:206-880(-)
MVLQRQRETVHGGVYGCQLALQCPEAVEVYDRVVRSARVMNLQMRQNRRWHRRVREHRAVDDESNVKTRFPVRDYRFAFCFHILCFGSGVLACLAPVLFSEEILSFVYFKLRRVPVKLAGAMKCILLGIPLRMWQVWCSRSRDEHVCIYAAVILDRFGGIQSQIDSADICLVPVKCKSFFLPFERIRSFQKVLKDRFLGLCNKYSQVECLAVIEVCAEHYIRLR